MSFILDALRKSEHERERRLLPGLVEAPRPTGRGSARRWVVVLVAALVVLNSAAWAYLLWANRAVTVRAATAVPPATAAAATPRPTPTEGRGVVRSLADEALAPGRTAPYDDVPPLARRAPTVRAAAVDHAPALPAATRAPAEADATAGLPTRGQLPANVASALPALSVDLHVYSPEPAQRFVVISGQRAQEGATVAGGVVIEKITPDGAIAVFRGTRFLLTRE